MIVAHHFVVNSGVATSDGVMMESPLSPNNLFLWFFGAWGKTGINCFMMITGYFMCTSRITLRKFVKLMAQIYCIRFIIYPILLIGGYETLSLTRIVKLLMPVWGFNQNFTSCFIMFWLTIPFLNILVQHMNKRQHQVLLLLLLGAYTILGSIPTFSITFNYVTWFAILFFVASFIRLYPHPVFERKALWGWLTLATVLLAMGSVVAMLALWGRFAYHFLSDSNRIFAFGVAVCSFLWFKNMDIRQSKVINAFGAGTFGVLLIHANSDAMRQWLWKDTVDVVGHYQTLATGELIMYSVGVVLAIFMICNLIDQLRIATIEKWFFRWYDNKVSAKADAFIQRITQ